MCEIYSSGDNNLKLELLNEKADIVIEHILVELRHDMTNNFRTYIDSYTCYKHGFITRNNTINHELYYRKGFMTDAARNQVVNNVNNNEKINYNVTREHVVPISFHAEQLLDIFVKKSSDKDNIGNIKNYLDLNVLYCIVTKYTDECEDTNLNILRSGMPENWTRNDNPWLRYHQCDISSKNISYVDNTGGNNFDTTDCFRDYVKRFKDLL